MSVTVIVPTTLRNYAQGADELTLEGATVGEVLNNLVSAYPETGKIVFDEENRLRGFINIFLENESIRALDNLNTKVADGQTLTILPAIAGGSGAADETPEITEAVKLDNDEILRYSRHLLLKEIGIKGQKKLKAAKVLIAGLGGLGTPLAQYLAAAGVGTLGLVDFDEVDLTNLQRQVIHTTRDVGRPKVASAKDSIRAINPKVKVEIYREKLTAENVTDIISGYDVIADATDNFVARYLINDAAALLGKPVVFGAMLQFEGQVTVFWAGHGPCYRCVYPNPPEAGLVPTCSQSGALGVLAGVIGSLEATEAVKLITGGGEPLIGKILSMDIWHNRFSLFKVKADPHCALCGSEPVITRPEAVDYEDFCGLKPKETETAVQSIGAKELKRRLDDGEKITVVDVREPHERSIVKFPDAKVIPIGQLARRMDELDPDADTVFVCKEGRRSEFAVKTILEAGFKGPCFNLKDGLNAWARDVDKSLPQY